MKRYSLRQLEERRRLGLVRFSLAMEGNHPLISEIDEEEEEETDENEEQQEAQVIDEGIQQQTHKPKF